MSLKKLFFPGDKVLDDQRLSTMPYDSMYVSLLEKPTMSTERINRSEFHANLSLVPTTDKPEWMNPAPIRTCRKTYGVLAIAQRHPILFGWLNRKG